MSHFNILLTVWAKSRHSVQNNFFLLLFFFFLCVCDSFKEKREANRKKRFAAIKIESVEELETLAAGTKPGTAHHQWPEEREAEREELDAFADLPLRDEKGSSPVR